MTDHEMLLIAGPNRALLAYDLRHRKTVAYIADSSHGDAAARLLVTSDRSTLLQVNDNGGVYIYRVQDQVRLLSGYYLDDELILHDDRGYYWATPEGAHYVYLKFPGVPGYHSFQQFARTLHRPQIVLDTLAGRNQLPEPMLKVPPILDISAEPSGAGGARVLSLRYQAASAVGLQRLVVYVDGRPVREEGLSGQSAEAAISMPVSVDARWISIVAVDAMGYESVPQGRQLAGAGRGSGQLFAIAVGTDTYEDTEIDQLYGARRDATNIVDALRTLQGSIYAKVEAEPMPDDPDLKVKLTHRIGQLVGQAGPADTIVLFVAGHGVVGSDKRFYLLTRKSTLSQLEETSIAWDDIAAAFEGTKARVVVLLDACQSGAAGGRFGSNDDAVSALLSRSMPMTVLAAAKGRQDSLETPAGGHFTNAFVKAIRMDRKTTDSNGNGVIELAELYSVVKRDVMTLTQGRQAPWIARNNMVGEIPLF